MEIVSALIDMSVGVAEGWTAVGTTDVWVAVGERGVWVGEKTAGVGKTFTEKLHAASSNALNRQISVKRNHFRCFMTFSLSAVAGWYFQQETIIKRLSQASCSLNFGGIIGKYPRIDEFRAPA
jgi:hypothetical protein